MNYEYLNKMIQYIEEHFTEKIEYKELAKLPSTNYEIEQELYLEMYSENNCYIYIPIKDKQNWFRFCLSF